MSFPLGELEETTGMPVYYMDEACPALNLSLNEAIDVAQNRPLWRMVSKPVATYS